MNAAARLSEWFNTRTRSEQVLLALTAVSLFCYLVFAKAITPLRGQQTQLLAQIETQKQQAQASQTKLATMRPEDLEILRQSKRDEVARAQQELAEAERGLQSLRQQLVPAGQMVNVLRDLLRLHKNVQLTSLEKMPVEELVHEESKTENIAASNFFKHPLKLILRGKYLDLLQYMSAVERMPWGIFWEDFTLVSDTDSKVEVTVQLYTISTERTWFQAG